ncbi:hypothetical protein HDU84_004624 [Entophlyctis sp. JEL0112]|nr:hypothetical protein HDU84_004624 [Entophlyctis sp. JEL0112]
MALYEVPSDFENEAIFQNFDAFVAKMSSFDTGRFISVPVEDFRKLPKIVVNIQNDKYFQECGWDLKRDARFAEAVNCPPESGRFSKATTKHDPVAVHKSLVAMLRAWSDFAKSEGIMWWISHGAMLGWFWNGKFLPWDKDVDVQMSMHGLLQLAFHNQTILDGRFLIDVSPSIYVRTPQPNGIIDARIVDTETGYFIDITGLAELEPRSDENIMQCKSPHYYKYSKLMPLIETSLEGVKVWRPKAVMRILADEYQEKSLFSTSYTTTYKSWTAFYYWDSEKREWADSFKNFFHFFRHTLCSFL